MQGLPGMQVNVDSSPSPSCGPSVQSLSMFNTGCSLKRQALGSYSQKLSFHGARVGSQMQHYEYVFPRDSHVGRPKMNFEKN